MIRPSILRDAAHFYEVRDSGTGFIRGCAAIFRRTWQHARIVFGLSDGE